MAKKQYRDIAAELLKHWPFRSAARQKRLADLIQATAEDFIAQEKAHIIHQWWDKYDKKDPPNPA